MQFEPRLFSPEPTAPDAPSPSASNDLTAGLPGDLALLAEQLHDDAAFLAERFPARAAAAPQRRRKWLAAAAAALLATGLGWTAWKVGGSQSADAAVGNIVTVPQPAASNLGEHAGLPIVREEEPALVGRLQREVSSNLVGVVPKPLPRTRNPARDEAALLRRQVVAFEQVIERLQNELRARADQQTQTDATIAELRREIAELRSRLDAQP
jgi:hypothetical protein